jgi:hypothetical protein
MGFCGMERQMKRPARLAGMAGIGVDRMGALADATGRRDILRFENLDTDVPPPDVAMRITGEAARSDEDNSYLPFVGQVELRRVVAQHVGRLTGVPHDGADLGRRALRHPQRVAGARRYRRRGRADRSDL